MVTVSMRKIVISIRRNVWEEFSHVYDNDEEVSWSGRLWAEKLWRTCIYRGFLVDRYLSLSSIIAIIELTISPLPYRFIYSVPNSCLLTLIISNSTITLFSIIFDLLPFETLLPSMPTSPHRYISIPIKSDCWKHQTVQGHISHSPRQHPLIHQYQYQTVQVHITHPPR